MRENHEEFTWRYNFLKVHASNIWMVTMVWRWSHCLLKKRKKLYNIEGLFGQNEQDLVKIISFISWTCDVIQCGLVNKLVHHNIIPNVVSVGSLVLVWPTILTVINLVTWPPCLTLNYFTIQAYKAWVSNTCRWTIISCHWNMCKSTIIIDLHIFFSNV